jgi:hypothetical protein
MSGWQDLEDSQAGVVGVTQLPVPKPFVPSVIELHDDHLHWANLSTAEATGQTEIHVFPTSRGQAHTEKQVPVYESVNMPEAVDLTGALDRFARLRSGEDVLRFAQRYGVLDLCQHGLPQTHNPRLLSIPLFGLIQSPSLWKPVEVGTEQQPSFVIQERGERPWCEAAGVEAISVWLYWSRMAAAILNVASALRRNVPTQRADWEVIITEESEERSSLIESLLARRWIGQIYLQEAVNRWLHLANVRLSLSWAIGLEDPSLQIEADTFGLLGVQILSAVTGAQSLAICDGCGKPYVRERRRPQTGRANYCLDCRERKVPERERQRRRRARATQTQS